MTKEERWLHEVLMSSSNWYNHCWWTGNETTTKRMREELARTLDGPHG